MTKNSRTKTQGNAQGHRLIVSYLGTPYSGWQRQPGKVTVQELIEKALSKIWGSAISAQASGRTDTGVHASAQVVHFDTEARREPLSWVRGTNSNLHESARVLCCSA